MPSERIHNGKSCRFYRAGSIWVSSDGTVAGMSDRKNHIKNLPIKTDDIGKFVEHEWYGRGNIDEAVITCFCPPAPKDGKRYVIRHKDGDMSNCDKFNLEWTPYHYHHTDTDKVKLNILGTTYTVCRDGTIKRGSSVEAFHDNMFDPDMGLECCLDTYLSVPRKKSIHDEKVYIDEIMKDAGYVQGDDAGLINPVILHIDEDWKNFSSENLEWTEKDDPRYVSYLDRKMKDRRKRSEELNKGRYMPDDWI